MVAICARHFVATFLLFRLLARLLNFGHALFAAKDAKSIVVPQSSFVAAGVVAKVAPLGMVFFRSPVRLVPQQIATPWP